MSAGLRAALAAADRGNLAPLEAAIQQIARAEAKAEVQRLLRQEQAKR